MYKKMIIIPPEKIKIILMPNQELIQYPRGKNNRSLINKSLMLNKKGLVWEKKKILVSMIKKKIIYKKILSRYKILVLLTAIYLCKVLLKSSIQSWFLICN